VVRVFWYFLAALVAAAIGIGGYLEWSGNQPAPRSTNVTIHPGDGVSTVARHLVDEGVVEEPYSFIFWSYRTGTTAALKAGEYQIDKGTSLRRILGRFVEGDVVTYSITLVEGWTFKQFLSTLESHPILGAGIADRNPAEIMSELGLAELHPEGRFFPDTYVFDSGTSGIDVLRQAFGRMRDVLDLEWQKRGAATLLKNREEALVLASIIEKETGKPEEREIISAVFNNRLRRKMRLQTDPTVIYGLGDSFDGNLKRSHLRQDTPYNTYTRHGLPPTPIANPGADSIRAALHPADFSALYFVSRGDGSHYFSETLEEHNQAVARYQLGRNN
jgi:UPF0755 protein